MSVKQYMPKSFTGVMVLGGLVGAFYLYRQSKKTAEAVVDFASENLNPVDDNNIANRGFNAAWKKVTGYDVSLGSKIAEWVHERNEDEAWKK